MTASKPFVRGFGPLLVLCALVACCRANYTFSLTFYSYTNPHHGRADGRCCDEPTVAPPSCTADCDNTFTVCVRPAAEALPESLESAKLQDANCTLGLVVTEAVDNQDNLTFSPLELEFSGNTWPAGFQLLVQVVDRDIATRDDFVDVLVVDMPLSPSDSPSLPTHYPSRAGVSNFGISFGVECSAGLFGDQCSVFCEPRNDSTGHFTCGSGGERVCLEGYGNLSTNCTDCVPADGCSDANGYCDEPGDCLCKEGFSGDLCTQRLVSEGNKMVTIFVGVGMSLVAVLLVAMLLGLLLWNRTQVKELLYRCNTKSHAVYNVTQDNTIHVPETDLDSNHSEEMAVGVQDYIQPRRAALQYLQSIECPPDSPNYAFATGASWRTETAASTDHEKSVFDPYGNYRNSSITRIAQFPPLPPLPPSESDMDSDVLFDDENYGSVGSMQQTEEYF